MSKRLRLSKEDRKKAFEALKQQLDNALNPGATLNVKVELGKDNAKAAITFTDTAWQKMNTLVDLSDKEIGWHFTAKRCELSEEQKVHFQAHFHILDVYLFPQEVTGVTVESIDETYGPWMMGLEDEVFEKLRGHGHSHVRMACTPSGQDSTHQNTLLRDVSDYYIFLIMNKHGSVYSIIYDMQNNALYDNTECTIIKPTNPYKDWAKAEIEAHVTEKKYTPVTTYAKPATGTYHNAKTYDDYNGYSGYQGYSGYDTRSKKDKKDKKKSKTYESYFCKSCEHKGKPYCTDICTLDVEY